MKWVKTEVSPYLLFLPLCYGVFIAADDMTLVVTILPDMMQSLKIPINDITRASWLIISFLIGYSATMPIMGRLSDRWGYRATFLVALGVFMVGSVGVALISGDDWFVGCDAVVGSIPMGDYCEGCAGRWCGCGHTDIARRRRDARRCAPSDRCVRYGRCGC